MATIRICQKCKRRLRITPPNNRRQWRICDVCKRETYTYEVAKEEVERKQNS